MKTIGNSFSGDQIFIKYPQSLPKRIYRVVFYHEDDESINDKRHIQLDGINKIRQEEEQENYRLVYAVGSINLNANSLIDGSGKTMAYRTRKSITAYWNVEEESSFYGVQKSNGYFRPTNQTGVMYNNLDQASEVSSAAAEFLGWFTEPEKGRRIQTIEDVREYTNLFDYSSNEKMREITLYAHWKLKTCNLRVHAINTGQSYSILWDNESKQWIRGIDTSYITIKNIPYNTNIIHLLNIRFRYPMMVSIYAGQKIFNSADLNTKLESGKLQPFRGWSLYKDVTRFDTDRDQTFKAYSIKEDMDIYPQFAPLVLWQRAKDGKIKGGMYICPNKASLEKRSLDYVKKQAPSPNKGQYKGRWHYTESAFPLIRNGAITRAYWEEIK